MNKVFAGMIIACLLATPAAWGKVGGGDINFSVKGAGNVVYSHDTHVTRVGLKCTDCHYKIFKMAELQHQATMADMQNGSSCGACHNGQRAFTVKMNCNRCHG